MTRPQFAITADGLLTFNDGGGLAPICDVPPAFRGRVALALDQIETQAASVEALTNAGRAVLCAQHFGGGGAREMSRGIALLEDALRGGDPRKPWGPQENVCGSCGLPAVAHGPDGTHAFASPVPWFSYQRDEMSRD